MSGSAMRAGSRSPADQVGGGFIALYALAYLSTALLFIAPLLVTLALKVNSLVGIDRAPASLSLIAGVGALVSIVANPFFGQLSDRTTSRERGPITPTCGIAGAIHSNATSKPFSIDPK